MVASLGECRTTRLLLGGSVPCLQRESLKDSAGRGVCSAAALGVPRLSAAPAWAEEPRGV